MTRPLLLCACLAACTTPPPDEPDTYTVVGDHCGNYAVDFLSNIRAHVPITHVSDMTDSARSAFASGYRRGVTLNDRRELLPEFHIPPCLAAPGCSFDPFGPDAGLREWLWPLVPVVDTFSMWAAVWGVEPGFCAWVR